jgi:hypothetical protein
MSSGGSSHPDPPPGFTVTSGANWTLDYQYEATGQPLYPQAGPTKMPGNFH